MVFSIILPVVVARREEGILYIIYFVSFPVDDLQNFHSFTFLLQRKAQTLYSRSDNWSKTKKTKAQKKESRFGKSTESQSTRGSSANHDKGMKGIIMIFESYFCLARMIILFYTTGV